VVDHLAGDVAMVRARAVQPVRPAAGPLHTPDGKSWG
jgi:hypothetical protein